MQQRIHSRQFEIDFFNENDQWRIVSRLNDDIHDILATLNISVPEMIVVEATVEFIRYPMQECLEVPSKIKELKGTNLFEDYSEKVRGLFLGPQGCPNVLNLLTTSAPALIYFYFPEQIKKGSLRPEEWWQMCGTRLANSCIAHQMLAKKYSQAR